jgi:hypothetical protein
MPPATTVLAVLCLLALCSAQFFTMDDMFTGGGGGEQFFFQGQQQQQQKKQQDKQELASMTCFFYPLKNSPLSKCAAMQNPAIVVGAVKSFLSHLIARVLGIVAPNVAWEIGTSAF